MVSIICSVDLSLSVLSSKDNQRQRRGWNVVAAAEATPTRQLDACVANATSLPGELPRRLLLRTTSLFDIRRQQRKSGWQVRIA